MELLHRVATERGLAEVWCHAQISAVPFYEDLGYTEVGERFFEAGIEHVAMRRGGQTDEAFLRASASPRPT